ncbi:hypothetical protein PM082_013612 [Marasmius tenuissimus]|nr:hypothetical protein PM082_013612 [Marasmius tenuissimus]
MFANTLFESQGTLSRCGSRNLSVFQSSRRQHSGGPSLRNRGGRTPSQVLAFRIHGRQTQSHYITGSLRQFLSSTIISTANIP